MAELTSILLWTVGFLWADNTPTTVSSAELREALRSAGEAMQ